MNNLTNYSDIELVSSHLPSCRRCDLWANGMAIPFVGKDIKCILFAEAPGSEEIKQKTPFVGKSGHYLMETFAKYGLERDNFLIINSCNCRPIKMVNDKIKDGKPEERQMEACRPINQFYIDNAGVKHIMTLGNYSKWFYTGTIGGISQEAGKTIKVEDFTVVFNYHPASVFYNSSHREEFEQIINHFCNLLN